jgi:quinol monooxygenase YgiN
MIIIAGSATLRPGQREEAVRQARRMQAATVAEPGCRAYRVTADLDNSDTFHIFEEWETPAALASHFQTPHLHAFSAYLAAALAAPMRVTRYEVAATAPL